jgi:orotate phosphoribosyltransferase-like protein
MVAAQNTAKEYARAFKTLKHPPHVKLNLWCRGSSGSILATLFALYCSEYTSRVVYIRKDGEDNHHGSAVLYDGNALNIIIDDFVCTGDTINAIVHHVKMYCSAPPDIIIASNANRLNLQNVPVIFY